MQDKTYAVQIKASKQHVWDNMLGEQTYKEWIKGFSENSEMIGEWKEGTQVDFIDSGRGGTRATLTVVDEPNHLVATHIAGLSKDRIPTNESMENWIGTKEEYVLSEKNGTTTLTINMHYHPDFESMLDAGWNTSLPLLKDLCEQGVDENA